jgi:uroporphyrinogen-III synthase
LLDEALAAPGAHVWLFSSSEAVSVLAAQAVPGASWASARAIATHPRIAESARAAGFGQVSLARPDLAAVVACLQSLPPTVAS